MMEQLESSASEEFKLQFPDPARRALDHFAMVAGGNCSAKFAQLR